MMPSLSDRLQEAIRPDGWMAYASEDYKRAIEVCALVEAFQAAEQEYNRRCDAIDPDDMATRTAASDAYFAAEAAKARLLEVNLG